jgi:hypothetical protein
MTPLIYGEWWYRFIGIGFWHINTLPTALAAAVVGVLLAFVFYHAPRGWPGSRQSWRGRRWCRELPGLRVPPGSVEMKSSDMVTVGARWY